MPRKPQLGLAGWLSASIQLAGCLADEVTDQYFRFLGTVTITASERHNLTPPPSPRPYSVCREGGSRGLLAPIDDTHTRTPLPCINP